MRRRTSKRKILFVLADRQGCGHYRCLLPAWYLQIRSNKFHTTCLSDLSIADLYCYDMVIFQRHFEDRVKLLWNAAKDSGAVVAYETDDDFFNIRPINPAYKYIDNNAKQNVRNFMKMSDAVIVSTEHLKKQMKTYSQNIHVIPNMIELDQAFLSTCSYGTDGEVRIVYAGGPSHSDDFKGMEEAIVKLLDNFGNKIKVMFMGWAPPILKKDSRVINIGWILSVGEYLRTMALWRPHIGICPLEDNIFNRSKSNMKWLEYTSVGAVTVASSVLPYQEVIENGISGVLVDVQRSRDWYDALADLINNTDKLQPMVNAAARTIEEKQLNIITSPLLVDTMDTIFSSSLNIREKNRKRVSNV